MRESPIELPLGLPYLDLVVDQWERRRAEGAGENVKVWDLRREYVWAILNEIGIYSHHFRFTRANDLAHNPDISAPQLKNWMGWARLETAYKYIERVRSQRDTGEIILKQYLEQVEKA